MWQIRVNNVIREHDQLRGCRSCEGQHRLGPSVFTYWLFLAVWPSPL